MILPPVARVFFAIDLSDDTKHALAIYLDSLKLRSKTDKIRWTRPENLHITLQFLAEVRGEDVPEMLRHVQKALTAATSPVNLSFKSLHLFPDPHRPRVLVLDVSQQESLAEWSALVGKGIQDAGYDIEDRPFRAHLSIGRIKTSQMKVLNFIADVMPPAMGEIAVNEVVLFQSEPQADGSRYVPLERIALGA
tara:strand:+ start:103 stop:681 length:579 start_codon:yes stop_codon:yes gene_type:complete